MRVLFVEPRYWYYTGKNQSHFPLGPAYVGAALIQAGHHVEGINCNQIEGDFEDLAAIVLDRFFSGSFELFAMGGLCITFEFQRRLFNLVREKYPGAILVSGGNLLSSEPEICFNAFGLDFGVIGEGEVTTKELCNVLDAAGSPENVNGINKNIEERVEDYLLNSFPDKYPMLSYFIGDKSREKIQKAMMKELETMGPQVMNQAIENLETTLDIEAFVKERVSMYSTERIEQLIQGILASEFKFIDNIIIFRLSF